MYVHSYVSKCASTCVYVVYDCIYLSVFAKHLDLCKCIVLLYRWMCVFLHLWIWSSDTDICCLLLALYTNLCDKVFPWIWHSYFTRLADQWATRLPQSQPLYEFSFMYAFYVIVRDTNSGSQDCKGSTLKMVLCLQHSACNPSIKIQLDAKAFYNIDLNWCVEQLHFLRGSRDNHIRLCLSSKEHFMNIYFPSWIFSLPHEYLLCFYWHLGVKIQAIGVKISNIQGWC